MVRKPDSVYLYGRKNSGAEYNLSAFFMQSRKFLCERNASASQAILIAENVYDKSTTPRAGCKADALSPAYFRSMAMVQAGPLVWSCLSDRKERTGEQLKNKAHKAYSSCILIQPCRKACTTAAVRSFTDNFLRIDVIWFFTVWSLILSDFAISLLLFPRAI